MSARLIRHTRKSRRQRALPRRAPLGRRTSTTRVPYLRDTNQRLTARVELIRAPLRTAAAAAAASRRCITRRMAPSRIRFGALELNRAVTASRDSSAAWSTLSRNSSGGRLCCATWRLVAGANHSRRPLASGARNRRIIRSIIGLLRCLRSCAAKCNSGRRTRSSRRQLACSPLQPPKTVLSKAFPFASKMSCRRTQTLGRVGRAPARISFNARSRTGRRRTSSRGAESSRPRWSGGASEALRSAPEGEHE